MADEFINKLPRFLEEAQERILAETNENYPLMLVEQVYQLWWHWADFALYVVNPVVAMFSPPHIIKPSLLAESSEEIPIYEPVYDIHDYGQKLMTSKGEDLVSSGMSMFKLYSTIEKMFHILIERLRQSGIDTETEVQIAFGGHELAQRKAFETVINLPENVIVTNFDPSAWGENYLAMVKRLAAKGYGYPPEAPRDKYRHPPQRKTPKMR